MSFRSFFSLPRSSQNFQRRTLINRVLQCLFCAAIREHQGCSQSIATMKYGIYECSDEEESHALIHFHEPFHNRLFKVRRNKTFPAHRIQAHLVPLASFNSEPVYTGFDSWFSEETPWLSLSNVFLFLLLSIDLIEDAPAFSHSLLFFWIFSLIAQIQLCQQAPHPYSNFLIKVTGDPTGILGMLQALIDISSIFL